MPSVLGLPAHLSSRAEGDALRAWLLPLAGEDTELVMSVLVHDESYVEVAGRLGLTTAVARKRFHRAVRRARKMANKIP
ncbi:sigma-70 family RNA polymerase sigma factor [Myxococcus xanthus]|uniref:sigma-70 family RNA polymerase sigma factor n=1 Tax=Myxococcus xanthus TaxID=34 RepID=UPI00191776E9|nr:sigma-70 family RNA polymerase sigma factor [Myxococcus xanthus]QQR46203.1 sigma-70 family RNA polymerase sigma factor [Myxococcus xanthus]